jgi:hypothetical protein
MIDYQVFVFTMDCGLITIDCLRHNLVVGSILLFLFLSRKNKEANLSLQTFDYQLITKLLLKN